MTDTTHKCPAPDCANRVPFDQLACRAHWYMIPKPLRDRLWSAYRNEGMGSTEHGEAVDACISFLRGAL